MANRQTHSFGFWGQMQAAMNGDYINQYQKAQQDAVKKRQKSTQKLAD